MEPETREVTSDGGTPEVARGPGPIGPVDKAQGPKHPACACTLTVPAAPQTGRSTYNAAGIAQRPRSGYTLPQTLPLLTACAAHFTRSRRSRLGLEPDPRCTS